MKLIPLTQGRYAIVDDADFALVSFFRWCACRSRYKWYARSFVRGAEGLKIRMHQLILDPPDGKQVDHKNGNGLDNRRCNLRVATMPQNGANRPKQKNNTSGYKGVSHWHDGRWQAAVKVHQKRIPLGLFRSKLAAARAYDKAARKYHGKFARTNFA